MKRRRQYTRDFKIGVIREVESGKTLAQVSRENGISPSLIVKWRKQYFDDPENAFRGNGKTYKENARIAELERLVGQLYAENEFLNINCCNHLSCGQKRFPLFELFFALEFKPQDLILEPWYFQV